MPEGTSSISRRRAAARVESSLRYQQKRRELIQAAAHVFGERGFDSTSIQDVADVLGIKRATLYYYVSSKEELFRDVVHEAVRGNVETVERIQRSVVPPADKVREIITALMRSYSDNYPYLYVWVQEDMARLGGTADPRNDQLAGLGRRYQKAVQAIVNEGIADGTFAGFDNPRLVAFGIVGMVNWTHRWFRPNGRIAAEEVADTFARMVLLGLENRGGRAPNGRRVGEGSAPEG